MPSDPLSDYVESLLRPRRTAPDDFDAFVSSLMSSPEPAVSVAEQARQRLMQREGITPEEVKRRAAAGVVQDAGFERQMAAGGTQIDPETRARAMRNRASLDEVDYGTRSGLVAGGVGAAEGLVQTFTAPGDILAQSSLAGGGPAPMVRAATRIAPAVARGYQEAGVLGALGGLMGEALPVTTEVSHQADRALESGRRFVGVPEGANTDVGDAIMRMGADLAMPIPAIGKLRPRGVSVIDDLPLRAEPVLAEEGARLGGGRLDGQKLLPAPQALADGSPMVPRPTPEMIAGERATARQLGKDEIRPGMTRRGEELLRDEASRISDDAWNRALADDPQFSAAIDALSNEVFQRAQRPKALPPASGRTVFVGDEAGTVSPEFVPSDITPPSTQRPFVEDTNRLDVLGRSDAPAPAGQRPRVSGDVIRDSGPATAGSGVELSPSELETIAYTDELTGVANRRGWARLQRKPVQAQVDLDNLKFVNDNLGHAAGDSLLRVAARVLKKAADEVGADLARVGGDEFKLQVDSDNGLAALLNNVSEKMTRARIEYVDAAGRKVRIANEHVKGFSFGVGKTEEAADAALRKHKLDRKAAGIRVDREPVAVDGRAGAAGDQLGTSGTGRNVRDNVSRRGVTATQVDPQLADMTAELRLAAAGIFDAETPRDIAAALSNLSQTRNRLIKPVAKRLAETGLHKSDGGKAVLSLLTTERIANLRKAAFGAGDASSVAGWVAELEAATGKLTTPKPKGGAQARPPAPPQGPPAGRPPVPPPPGGGAVPPGGGGPPVPVGIDAYIRHQATARQAAKSAPGTTMQKAKSAVADAKAKLVDFAAPIEDVLNDTLQRNQMTLKPSEHITNQIDRSLRAQTIASQFIKDGGLEGVIKDVPDIEYLDQYLIARHAQLIEGTGRATGRNPIADAEVIQRLAPVYEPYAQRVYQYARRLIAEAVDRGLVSAELAARLNEQYPTYVPFKRVFNELEKAKEFGTRAIASLSKQSIVQKLEGSDRLIESPIESLMLKSYDVFRQGEKNLAGRMLAGYEALPGNPFEIRELKAGEHAPHTFTYLENGKPRRFATTKEVAAAAKALDVQTLGPLLNMAAVPVRIARAGITGLNPTFIAANVVRDQFLAAVTSNHVLKTSLLNPDTTFRALLETFNRGDLYDEMVRNGALGTSYDMARNQVEETVKSVRAKRSATSAVVHTITSPAELLRFAENIVGRAEEFTRIQQYIGTKKAYAGMDPREAQILASLAARKTTVDFFRRGEYGTPLNATVLYLNAGIQGARTLLRTASTNPVGAATKFGIAIASPVAIATFWNMSDPARREVYEDIEDYEKENNLIFVLPNSELNDSRRWSVMKMPLPPGLSDAVTVLRRSIEALHGFDPVTAGEIGTSLIGTVSPFEPTARGFLSSLVPQAIKPTLEAAVNRNFFTGRPIVPDNMARNLPANEQVHPNTSGTARIVADLASRLLDAGVSPLQVEHWIRATGGGVGMHALNLSDQALAAFDQIPEGQIGGESIGGAFDRRFMSAAGGAKERREREAQRRKEDQNR